MFLVLADLGVGNVLFSLNDAMFSKTMRFLGDLKKTLTSMSLTMFEKS